MPSPKVERIPDKRTTQRKNHQERTTTSQEAIEGNPVEKNTPGYTLTIGTIEKVRRNLGRYPEQFGNRKGTVWEGSVKRVLGYWD